MAVVNTKSTAITNADAGTFNLPHLVKGSVLEGVGVVSVAAADDDNSVYRITRVPSNARVTSVKVVNDAITGGTAYAVGFRRTAEDGGAAVGSANQLAATVDMSSARAVPTEVLAVTELNSDKRVFELLGLSADPNLQYDICLLASTVGSGAGDIAVKVQYVI